MHLFVSKQIKELDPILGASLNGHSASQIIWTSSSAAQECQFNEDDIQHKKGSVNISPCRHMSQSAAPACFLLWLSCPSTLLDACSVLSHPTPFFLAVFRCFFFLIA